MILPWSAGRVNSPGAKEWVLQPNFVSALAQLAVQTLQLSTRT